MVVSTMDHMDDNFEDRFAKKLQNMQIKVRSGSSLVNCRPLFSYNSKCLIVASGPNVKVYNVHSCECLHVLRYHKTNIISLQENKDNCLQFFSCSQDGDVVRWEVVEGTLLKVYKLGAKVTSFYAPTSNLTCFFTQKHNQTGVHRLYSYTIQGDQLTDRNIVFKEVLPFHNAIDFSAQGSFVAAVYDNALNILQLDCRKFVKHLVGKFKLKCVTCHPKESCVATGDDHGRVLVWSNIFDSKRPIRSIYHWHTLPVADLAFSTEGSYLYSGGGEACLVKWNLFSEEKWVLPRLGAPVLWLQNSPDSSLVAVSMDENSLQFIDSQRNIVGLIQGLTRGHFRGGPQQNILSTGLLFDAQTKSLVLNGKPGHLQFYSVFDDKHLFELDISARNFVSHERNHSNYNVDVSKAAFDERGRWMATIEYWCNNEVSPMIWLKFWEYNLINQKFVLNTNIYLPHNKEVNCIVFRPYGESDMTPIAVTTSEDCRFKTWTLFEDNSFEGKESWNCAFMDYYREHLPTGDASFSEDGSVLAIAVQNIASLWTENNTQLEAALFEENNERPIKQLSFGRGSCKHLLVCHDGFKLCVWNVLSLSIAFTINVAVQTLTADITSELFAVFAKGDDKNTQNLYIFKPDNPEPLAFMKNVSEKPILSALFVPKKREKAKTVKLEKSQLYFFNEDQCLFTLTNACDDDIDSNLKKIKMSTRLPMTPFGFLQAEQKVSDVKEIEQHHLVIEHPDSAKDSMDYPNPTYVNHFVICSKVLRSLLQSKPIQDPDSNLVSKKKYTEIKIEKDNSEDKLEHIDSNDLMETDNVQETKDLNSFITDFSFLRVNLPLS